MDKYTKSDLPLPIEDTIDKQIDTAINFLANEKFFDAYNQLTTVIKKEPQNGLALVHRAQACAILGKSDEMMQDIKAVVTLHPDWAQTGYTTRGYLKKYKGGKSGQSKKFYFVLKGRFMIWFVGEKGTLQNGAYLHTFDVTTDTKKEKFDINITNANPFLLEAGNMNDKNSWIRALKSINEQKLPQITLYTMQNDTIRLSDYVVKSGGKNKSFKKRWCVVKGNIFYYYERPTDPTPKGFWDLTDCELGRYKVDPGTTKFKWRVKLKEDSSKGRTEERNLHVESDEKRETWLKVLLEASKCSLQLVEKIIDRNPMSSPPLPLTHSPDTKPTPFKQKATTQKSNASSVVSLGSTLEERTNLSTVPFPNLNQSAPLTEIVELVSPRMPSFLAFEEREKILNTEALKVASSLGFREEWEENGDDFLPENETEGNCFIS